MLNESEEQITSGSSVIIICN